MPKRRKYGTKRPCRSRVPPCRTNPCPLCLRKKHGSLPGRIGRSSARGRRSGRGGLWKSTRPRRKCTDMPNPPHRRKRPSFRMRIPGLPRRRMNSPIRQSCVGNPSYRVFGRKYPNPRLWNPLHGGQQHTPLPRRKSRSPCRKRNGLPAARYVRPTTGGKRRLWNPLHGGQQHTPLPRRKSRSPCRKRNGLPAARYARPATGGKRRLRNPLQRQRRHERPDNPRRMGSQDRCSMLSIRRPNRSRC